MTHLWSFLTYSAAFAVFGIASGYLIARVPQPWFLRDNWVTTLRPFEYRGRWYDRCFGIRTWKDRLPEAGALFAGGQSKSTMVGFSEDELAAFAAETRRAETVHWANAFFGFTFFLWNPWYVGVVLVPCAFAMHLPFVAVQRYNRARVAYVVLGRRTPTG